MTTKRSGGSITGLLALTCEAQEALDRYDPVHLVGDYEVEKADGTKPVLGLASVINRGRAGTTTSSSVGEPIVPGDVTVEAIGFLVRPMELAGTVAAGAEVGFGSTGIVAFTGLPGTAGNSATVRPFGLALMGGDSGDVVDILVR